MGKARVVRGLSVVAAIASGAAAAGGFAACGGVAADDTVVNEPQLDATAIGDATANADGPSARETNAATEAATPDATGDVDDIVVMGPGCDGGVPWLDATVQCSGGFQSSRPISQDTVDGIAVKSGTVYWTSVGAVWSWAPPDGGVRQLATVGPKGGRVGAEVFPRGIAADSASVYWTEADSVKKLGLDGGQTSTLASGLTDAIGLAIDETNAYFTDSQSGIVGRIALDGGSVATLAWGQAAPTGIAVDPTGVYWTNFGGIDGKGGGVLKVSVGGGPVTLLAGADSRGAAGIAIDATNVYWANNMAATVASVPKAGGCPTSIAVVPSPSYQTPTPLAIAVDSKAIYFTTSSFYVMPHGLACRLAFASIDAAVSQGSPLCTEWMGEVGLGSLAIDSNSAYVDLTAYLPKGLGAITLP